MLGAVIPNLSIVLKSSSLFDIVILGFDFCSDPLQAARRLVLLI
jgi:hypothetical protein